MMMINSLSSSPSLLHTLNRHPCRTPSSSRRRSRNQFRSPSKAPPSDLKILIAPSGFKEALGPEVVARAIEEGIRRVLGHDENGVTIAKLPLHDGGEGFCRALVATVEGGEIRQQTVTGPVGDPVASHWGLLPGSGGGSGAHQDRNKKKSSSKRAVLDMAAAAGLRLVPETQRDPTRTTTFGVGELIKAALDERDEHGAWAITDIIVGCGDSGTSDGGAGMLQALGARLLDVNGHELPRAAGGATLARLHGISLDSLHPRLRRPLPGDDKTDKTGVTIQAVCNVDNVLCGENGVARVYGPQKGATAAQIETLSTGLENLAAAMRPLLGHGRDVSLAPGSGASGGLGAGLLLLGAQLRPRTAAINEYFHIDAMLDNHEWDFVFTAEGSLDSQSARGKMTVEIARRASRSQGGGARGRRAQVVALTGTIGRGADAVYFEGIEAFTSILREPVSLQDALRDTERLVREEAERSMRMILVGMAAMRESWDSGVDVDIDDDNDDDDDNNSELGKENMSKKASSPLRSRPEVLRVFTQ